MLVLLVVTTASIQVSEECDAMALKSVKKKELKPNYKYDS